MIHPPPFEALNDIAIGVVTVHGFNVHDEGDATIGRVEQAARDLSFEIMPFDWGWGGLLETRFGTNDEIDALIEFAETWVGSHQGGILLGAGHSHGCNLLYQATQPRKGAETGAPFHGMHWQNPALDAWRAPSRFSVKRVNVFHATDDYVVEAAEFRPGHPWGNQGRIGYCSPAEEMADERIHNTELCARLGVDGQLAHVGHSGVFEPPLLGKFFPLFIRSLRTLALEVLMGETIEV